MKRLSLLLLVACASEGPTDPVAERPDVVLITLDTTRADRLGSYGYALAHTEHLDDLANRGQRYERAFSPLPLTIPSHGSIFTGKYPPELGIRANGDRALGPEQLTLAEVLSDAGYVTMASVAAFVTTRQWGFNQGFDVYSDEIPAGDSVWHAERDAAAVVDDVLAWRGRQPQAGPPRFAWVHLYDAHFPYTPSEPWFSETERRIYDGELAYLDDQVGRVVEAFDDRPTIFVVVGDHGEGLGTHTEISHGLFVYNATQHVPFFISGPGVPRTVVSEPVSLVDLMPTVLSLLDLPIPEGLSGRVVPGTPPRPVYMESYQLEQRFGVQPHRAVVSGDWKLIDVSRPELYRQDGSDPDERRNVAAENPDIVADLQRLLQDFDFGAPTVEAGRARAPEVQRQLEALGYAEGTFLGDRSAPAPDPKDRLELVGKVQRLEHLVLEGRRDAVGHLVEELAADYPDVSEFQTRWAQTLAMRGDTEQAIALMERTLARDPGNAALLQGLAVALAKGQRYEEAAQRFQEAATLLPYVPRLRTLAVISLLEAPDGARPARELAVAYLEQYPDDLAVAGVLGVLLIKQGAPEVGVPLLERAVEADIPERDVAFHMAAVASGAGQPERARRYLEREIAHHPSNGLAVLALARSMGRGGHWQAQLSLVDDYLSPSEGAPARTIPVTSGLLADLWQIKAQALFNLKRYDDARLALELGKRTSPEHAELLLLDANLLWQAGEKEAAKVMFERAKAIKDSTEGPPTRSP